MTHCQGRVRDGRVDTFHVAGAAGAALVSGPATAGGGAGEAFRWSEERFRELAELLPEIVFETDEQGILTFVNRNAFAATGYSEEDFEAGFDPLRLIAPEDRARAAANIRRVMGAGPIGYTEYGCVRPDGTTFPAVVRAVPILRDGRVAGLRGIVIDVSDIKAAEQALRRSEANYRAIFDAASDGIVVHDIETAAVVDANRSALEMYGCTIDELRGTTIGVVSEGIPPYSDADAARLVAEAAAGEPLLFEWHARRKDGMLFWLEVNLRRCAIGGVGRVLAVIRDINERKRLEEDLRRAQKMEAVGRLAGGVAHDFNNLLTAILGYCEMLADETPDADPRRKAVLEIKRAGERAAALTAKLLAFSRRQVLDVKPVDLSALVADLRPTLERIVGDRVNVVTDLAADLRPVVADPLQLEQIVINLAVNARDAMPAGGTLSIATANLSGSDCPPSGPCVMLRVRDTGEGMDETTRARLFEPFFSTKGAARGTGLGLATVYGTVEQHRGRITVESAPGAGATFTVYLPRA